MITNNPATIDKNASLGNFAGELTDAAYHVALRHGVTGLAIDLELDLWHAIGETVRKWEQEIASSH
jgi:hypothetical protein